MRRFFAILINNFITYICKLFRFNGSQFPGSVVYDYIDKDILSKIKYPNITIAVTGSAGKGSACKLIKEIFEDNGYSVALNENGSNGINGSISMILNNTTLFGKFKKDVLLLECDERHLKLIWDKVKPKYMLITNITRDQPTRNATPINVFKDVTSIIDDSIHLFINADDPLLNRLKYTHHGKITTFGLDKLNDDIKHPLLNNIDFAYCPNCHKKLKYTYYHYGHLGKYSCPNCDFKRETPNYLAKNINLEKQSITINKNNIYIYKDVIYAAYATVAAYAIVNTIGIDQKNIVNSINSKKETNNLGKEITYKNHKIIMLETKNENNLSYYQSCKYIINQKGLKSVILGFDVISKRYKESDISWLYDINFELLNNKFIDKIFVFGKFKYDIATRLEYANIKKSKIVIIDKAEEVIDIAVSKTKADIYVYDVYKYIRTLISEVDR